MTAAPAQATSPRQVKMHNGATWPNFSVMLQALAFSSSAHFTFTIASPSGRDIGVLFCTFDECAPMRL
jgi:hypothetical protein